MLILLRTFILSNFIWVLLASSAASGFAGGLIVHKFHRASQLSALNAALEKREANDGKARIVASDIDRLSDGEPARRLFVSWNRNPN